MHLEFGKGSGDNEQTSVSEFSKSKTGDIPIERQQGAAYIEQ
jgi:hypothetical protein